MSGLLHYCEPGRIRTFDRLLRREVLYPAELRAQFNGKFITENRREFNSLKKRISSGWQDSNLRPPRPKRGAITGLRYTPKFFFKNYCGETGIRTLGTRCGVRRFSKPFLSATQAPLLINELP